jgi:hypothetical protein
MPFGCWQDTEIGIFMKPVLAYTRRPGGRNLSPSTSAARDEQHRSLMVKWWDSGQEAADIVLLLLQVND